MRVERVEKLTASELRHSDFSFVVDWEVVEPFDGNSIQKVSPVDRYVKAYELKDFAVADADQGMIAVIRDGNTVCGYIVLSQAWNNCAQIDDFAIEQARRRRGLAGLLMDEAVRWARERNLPAIRLETQTNNVGACRFYESYGFRLGGFDRYLYETLPSPARSETALFWYLSLESRQP